MSSKFLTTFSDLRADPSDPPHVSLKDYVAYLGRYADQEALRPLITYGAHVAAVGKRSDGKPGYAVRVEPVAAAATGKAAKGSATSKSKKAGSAPLAPPDLNDPPREHRVLRAAATLEYDAVCICSGLHEVPYLPEIAGMPSYTGEVLHSAQYKDKSVFANKRVLVVGCGETGMDLGYRAVQVASSCAMSIKRGFLSVPHEGWGGVPLDTLIANLFEHSYEHWWCHRHHIKWKVTTLFIRLGFFLTTGSSVGYNQYVGRVKNVKRGHHILCKSTAAIPHLNLPVKNASWRRFVPWFWWNEPKVVKPIHAHPAPASVKGKTVTFTDGSSFDADMIVFATGYRQTFPFLHADGQAQMAAQPEPPQAAAKARGRASCSPSRRRPLAANTDANADASADADADASADGGWVPCTGARGSEDPLPSEHFVISPDAPRLAFIGFVRPNVGAIPPMAEMQTFWWIERLRGRVRRGAHAPSYGLLGKKLNYGVDYGNYMHQLAAEIGAAPTLSTLVARPKALIAYALGQAYISFFRLQGPFASRFAWETASGELFRPVVDRGIVANAIFIVTMAVFAYMNLVAHVIEIAIALVAPQWLSRQRAMASRTAE